MNENQPAIKKVLIADDHQLFGEGLAALVSQLSGLQITGIASDGQQALDLLMLQPADLLITDIRMPKLDGIELVKRVKTKFHDTKILVISIHHDASIVEDVFEANAEGYILKDATREEFVKAITRLLDNGTYYSNSVLEEMLRKSIKNQKITEKPVKLTPRELEILRLIMEEYSSEEIAEKLFISKRTVDTHRKNILQKTHASTLVGLIKYAYEHNII
ncbi:MAG: response regulator [Bacteroidales bacterium]